MVLYLLKLENDTFNRYAVIDNATSVIWVQRFNAPGEFEVYIKASPELLELLEGDIFITRDDSNIAMYVEKVQLNTDQENGDFITISGHSAENLLSWRVIQRAVFSSATTTAEYIIRELIKLQWIIYSPIINNPDGVEWIQLGPDNEWDDKVTRQFTGKNLLDVVQELCVTYNYGLEFEWNGAGFTVNLYKGVDRSYDQTENTFVVFSPEFENLGNTEYIKDTSNYSNCCIVGGEGEGTQRVFVPVIADDMTGFYRRYIYIDARQSSSDGMSSSEYRKMLKNDGVEALELQRITTSFNGEILNYNNYTYGIDYNLGDKVSVINEYGIKGNATITEVTEVEDENGYRIVPTLSEWTVISYEEEE